jgi:Amino acid permease
VTPPEGVSDQSRSDEERLAELGYKQELSRTWSAFTNFAISFTIISVLAGCFTTFSFAWLNGGPVAVSWGWPILCFFIMMVGFSMAELTSAYPTAGGPYWWANDLGGKGWSWMTGWFNVVGLIGIVSSVAYGAAIFLGTLLGLYSVDVLGLNFGDTEHVLRETWILFALILILYTVVNIFADRFLALLNNISVGWHLLGVAIIIGLLIFVPDDHQSAKFVFTERFNSNGAFGLGHTSGLGFWLIVLPVGFLLTMYTETGYDASAHTSEETENAAVAAAQGVWRAIFYSALIGWVLLLAFLFAATDTAAVDDGAGFSGAIFTSALDSWAAKLVNRRAAVLRRRRADQCLAHLVRILARPGDPGLDSVPPGQPRQGALQRGDRGVGVLGDHRHPGTVREEQHPVRVLRPDRDLHGRAVHRVHHSHLPAISGEGQLHARPLDAGEPLQDREHPGDDLRRPGRLLARSAVHAGWAALERGLRRQPRELHAVRDPVAADLRGLVPGLGEEQVPGTGQDAGGGHRHQGLIYGDKPCAATHAQWDVGCSRPLDPRLARVECVR